MIRLPPHICTSCRHLLLRRQLQRSTYTRRTFSFTVPSFFSRSPAPRNKGEDETDTYAAKINGHVNARRLNFKRVKIQPGQDKLLEDADDGPALTWDDVDELIAKEQAEVEAKAELEVQPVSKYATSIEGVVSAAKSEYGEYLPEGLLNKEELGLYNALYGPPVKFMTEEEVAVWREERKERENVLEDAPGEEVWVDTEGRRNVEVMNESEGKAYKESRKDMIRSMAEKERSKIMGDELEEGMEEDEEGMESESESEESDDEHDKLDPRTSSPIDENYTRTHPLTHLGQFSTAPSTVFFPISVQTAIDDYLSDTSNRHLISAARAYSPPTLQTMSKKVTMPPQLHPAHGGMEAMDAKVWAATCLPLHYATAMGVFAEIRRRLGGEWVAGVRSILDFGGAGAAGMAFGYVKEAEEMGSADFMRESVKVKGGTKVKEEVKEEEEDGFEEGGKVKNFMVVGSYHLKQLVKDVIPVGRYKNVVLPKLPEGPSMRKRTGVIDEEEEIIWEGEGEVEPETSAKIEESEETTEQEKAPRGTHDLVFVTDLSCTNKPGQHLKQQLEQLWSLTNPNGGVLVLVDLGTPHGFENMARYREELLKRYLIDTGERTHYRIPGEIGRILAPCTNHGTCPMYTQANPLPGRKDFCHFTQRYQRPKKLREVLEKVSDTTDAPFTYLVVQRGIAEIAYTASAKVDEVIAKHEQYEQDGMKGEIPPGVEIGDALAAESKENQRAYMLHVPRLIDAPLKRRGHAVFDLCTPTGTLERWTLPKSYSRIAWRDARKAQWGDLWPLGAKTKMERKAREGQMKVRSNGVVVIDGEVVSAPSNKIGKYDGKARRDATKPMKKAKKERLLAVSKNKAMIKEERKRLKKEQEMRKRHGGSLQDGEEYTT